MLIRASVKPNCQRSLIKLGQDQSGVVRLGAPSARLTPENRCELFSELGAASALQSVVPPRGRQRASISLVGHAESLSDLDCQVTQ